MNNNTTMNVVQDHVDEMMQQLVGDPILSALASPSDLQGYLQTGFSALLNATLLKDRALYLEHHAEDRANGFAPARELQVKTTPVMVTRPRTRDGFFPAFLPKYQHPVPADYQELLEQILLEAKSFRAALRTLQTMGLSYSLKELEALLSELEQEAKLFHERPLNPDWLILYIDAKELDLKDEHDQVKKAAHFLALGVNFEGRKEVICSRIFWGHELLEGWKEVFVGLQNRGLTRFLSW
jgi:putative transposase